MPTDLSTNTSGRVRPFKDEPNMWSIYNFQCVWALSLGSEAISTGLTFMRILINVLLQTLRQLTSLNYVVQINGPCDWPQADSILKPCMETHMRRESCPIGVWNNAISETHRKVVGTPARRIESGRRRILMNILRKIGKISDLALSTYVQYDLCHFHFPCHWWHPTSSSASHPRTAA